jgi:hypothetical protein
MGQSEDLDGPIFVNHLDASRRAKKSGACLPAPPAPRKYSQNGCEEKAVTCLSKSSSIAWSRSNHDSYPTWRPIVADHHRPGQFR